MLSDEYEAGWAIEEVRTFQLLMASLWKHTKLSIEIKTIDGKVRETVGVNDSLTSVGAIKRPHTPPKIRHQFDI